MLVRLCCRQARTQNARLIRSLGTSNLSTTVSPKFDISQPTPFISTSTSPYFNLAFEDWIFRNTPAEIPLLIIYRNEPSVIIGRNQNPWKEINQTALQKFGVPFIRRRSGGGTVYHDLGNTNYSILIPRTMFERRPNAELVSRAIQTLGIPAQVNERNDIVVDGFKQYVSGSAYKIVNKRAYHHGTMLIDAQLHQLGDLLRNTKGTLITKGVESIKSAVRNLRQWKPDLTSAQFDSAVVKEFRNVYGGKMPVMKVDESLMDLIPGIKAIHDELKTWEWSHGQTPEFTHELVTRIDNANITANIVSKHGIITSISIISDDPSTTSAFQSLSEHLIGQKYGILENIRPSPATDTQSEIQHKVVTWLRREM